MLVLGDRDCPVLMPGARTYCVLALTPCSCLELFRVCCVSVCVLVIVSVLVCVLVVVVWVLVFVCVFELVLVIVFVYLPV